LEEAREQEEAWAEAVVEAEWAVTVRVQAPEAIAYALNATYLFHMR